MRAYFYWIPSLVLVTFLTSLPAFSEGVKQLNPDSTHNFVLVATAASGWYPCFAVEACDPDHKLFVRVAGPGEKVYIGLASDFTIWPMVFRVNLNGVVVFGPVTISQIHGSPGYIESYSQAYAGPSILSPAGYNAISFAPGLAGDYSIDFDNIYLEKFDVTVVDTTILPLTAIDGRLWAKDWQISTSGLTPEGAFLATQYILSDDSVVTSIDYNGMQGHHFDVTTTRNGCIPPPEPWDSSCRSRVGNHHYAQYKIFLNDPDSLQFPTGVPGEFLPGSISVVSSCEGLIIINFSVSKPGTVKINIDINPDPGIQEEDISVIDTVEAGANSFSWMGNDGRGSPVPHGDSVAIDLTYVNGLTNLALFDVEKNLHGFIIEPVRPSGVPIATFWNDTLLRDKGGYLQLTGCYSSQPSTGCHDWDGNYNGVGLGSENTVNTWWYAASSQLDLGKFVVKRYPESPLNISGPTSFCSNSVVTYTVSPNPLANSDSLGYNWVMTDVGSSLVDFDSSGKGAEITIPFGNFSPGDKRLKVRGSSIPCGFGSFGPGSGGEGILITTITAPVVTNSITTLHLCSGNTTNITLQSSVSGATFSYLASSNSPMVSGYFSDTTNPISQTLINAGTGVDSVIYRVIPATLSCAGDTTPFYVTVTQTPQVINTTTIFTLCSSDTTAIDLLANLPQTGFTWTAASGFPDITGYSDGSGPLIAQILSNTGTTTGSVNYTVAPELGGCFGPTKEFTVSVNPTNTVSISISASANPVCAGIPVVFTATSEGGGAMPVYAWTVNGVPAGTNGPVFSYLPSDGDLVRCTLTSSTTVCIINNPATSNLLTMTVHPNLPVSVSIDASSNPFCIGGSVTFTANPVNGGTMPSWQWKVNGLNVGTNNSTYAYNPVSGDVVTCVLTSSELCVSDNPAASNAITMTGSLTPNVSFSACFDTVTTVNAKPFKLKGGIPIGGTYIGTGVNSATGIFNPSSAGHGTHQIHYTYTNTYGCEASKSLYIVNLPYSIFNCGAPLTDIRDGKTYPTVLIGGQCWMASNLNYGSLIPGSQSQRDNCLPEKYCYNDAPAPCAMSSVLYQWDELMQYNDTQGLQGLCPPGWHVPTETEWNLLFSNWTNSGFAGSPLKYSGYSEFNALLIGVNHLNKQWNFSAFATFFWSSTAYGSTKAWSHGMNQYNPSVSTYPSGRANAFAVRCLKD